LRQARLLSQSASIFYLLNVLQEAKPAFSVFFSVLFSARELGIVVFGFVWIKLPLKPKSK
jgi:hypothetical protein